MKININNLVINCIIGVYDHERTEKQPIQLDIELSIETSEASITDDISNTVDYFELTKKISERVAESKFLLIEKLANFVASLCLEEPLVSSVKVKLSKPEALKAFGAEVSIELVRSK